jgi:tetratricopeptide (TPR) repeat protein
VPPEARAREPGDRIIFLTAQLTIGSNLWFLGAFEEAEPYLRSTVAANESFGPVSSYGALYLVAALADRGAYEEARDVAEQAISLGQVRGLGVEEGRAHWSLADVHLRLGELDAAEREAATALTLLAAQPEDVLPTTALLAAIQLAQGRPAEALATVRETILMYEASEVMGFKTTFALLVHAEALHATGDLVTARAAIGAARDRVCASAATIGDPEARRRFVEDVPEHARILALARQWLGEEGPALR